MPHKAADRIRNVALVGHRGCGKTSLHEAMLFEAGAVNRLGTVADGTTVSDHEPDEQERSLSINASLACFEHGGREINLIDTPGEPSFVADAIAALRVADAAVVVVNGVMGSRCTPSGSGAGPTPRGWRGWSSSTCSTASGPTSSARSTRSRPPSAPTSSPPRSRSAPSTRSAA